MFKVNCRLGCKCSIINVYHVSSMWVPRYRDLFWAQKSHRKIGNIHKDSELYQVKCQNVPIFPLYIWHLQEQSIHFGIQNYKRKINNIHKEFLNTNFSYIIFYAKVFQNNHFNIIYILSKLLTTWLTGLD